MSVGKLAQDFIEHTSVVNLMPFSLLDLDKIGEQIECIGTFMNIVFL